MAFIAIPASQNQSSPTPSAYQIGQMGENGFEPIGMMNFEPSLPIDGSKLAQNFAALLNGNNPIYHFGEDYQMFYEQHSSGMTFRFRPKHADGGVSEVGALVILYSGIEMEFTDANTD